MGLKPPEVRLTWQGWSHCFSKTEAIAMGKSNEWQSVLQKLSPLPRLCRVLDFGEHSEGKGLGVPGQVLGCRPEQEAHYHSPTSSTASSQLLSPSCSECHLVVRASSFVPMSGFSVSFASLSHSPKAFSAQYLAGGTQAWLV